jgi:hypothetical protein
MVDTRVIDAYGKTYHEVGCKLSGRGASRKAIGGVMLARVVRRRVVIEL